LSQSGEPVKPGPGADSPPGGRGGTVRRLAINAISNWFAIGGHIAVNMYLLSYVYRSLGEDEAFGVYRLGVVMSSAISYLAFGMAGSVLRLAAESVAACNWERLSETMSAVRAFLGAAAVLGMLLIVLASFFLLGPLNVPQELRPAAAGMFQLMALDGGIRLMCISYRGLLQAKQRYDLASVGLVGEAALRLAFVVLCFELGWVRLEALGASTAAAALCGLAFLVIMVRRTLPELRLSFTSLKRSAVRAVLGFGAWIAVAQASCQGLGQAGVPLVSATLGTAAAGVFSIPQMISNYLLYALGALTGPMRPVATTYAVHGRRDTLASLYYVGTRLSLTMLAPAVALLVAYGKPLLTYWMGPGMAVGYPVMVAYLILVFVRSVGVVGEQLILATGRIQGVAITHLIVAVAGIGMGVAVAIWTDWGLTAMVIGMLLPTALRGIFYLPLRMRRETQVAWTRLMVQCVLPPAVSAGVLAAAGWLLAQAWLPHSLFETLVQMLICGTAYIPIAWFAVLRPQDRRLAKSVLARRRGTSSGVTQTAEE